MRKYNVNKIIAVALCILVNVYTTLAQDCTTPKNDKGNCINILNCPSLLNLLKTQSNDPGTIAFLQSSTCGYEGKYPLVCCSIVNQDAKAIPTVPPPTPGPDPVPDPVVTESAQYRLPRTPYCGINNASNGKIVNGEPAALGEFPWIVALGYKNSKNPNLPKWLCGGSLITNKHVLTAGHCVHNRPDLYIARAGELDLYSEDDGASPVDVLIQKAKLHEQYNPSSITNDIAILTLSQPVSGPYISPICLPFDQSLRSQTFVRYYPFVAGWGAIYFNGPSSSHLQVTMLPVVSNDACKQSFANFKTTVIDERVLCAGYTRGKKDACQGDSGGPLMLAKGVDPHTFYQIGVVSYGFRCAEEGFPGVYTRVTAFLDWIEQNVE